MKVVVVGLGYVGLPLATVLSKVRGIEVVGIQRRSARSGWKIDSINRGKSPIDGDEPEIELLVMEAVETGQLVATDDFEYVGEADAVLITVQTPVDERKKPVLTHLEEACESIGKYLVQDTLVSLESTVPPGTTEYFAKEILEDESGLRAGVDFNLVYSYERVTPGRLVYNLVNLPRVIGGLTDKCSARGEALYSTFCKGELTRTDLLTAEMSKLVENTYRDVNIALANELSLLCGSLGVDYYEVKDLVNKLPFIEGKGNPFRNLHDPGAGVGGHCLPKDSHLLIYGTSKYGSTKPDARLVRTAREINDSMPGKVQGMINDALDEADRSLDDSKIAILGLAYKEDTDDYRMSPTVPLVKGLRSNVMVHDPNILNHPEINVQPLLDTLTGADCMVLMTGHRLYRQLELECVGSIMRTRVVVDGRNVFDPDECKENGFIYRGIGHAN